MLVLTGLICAGLVFRINASSPEAYGFTSPSGKSSSSSSNETPSISSITTRLILAQRLGLSQYHNLNGADEATIELLNGFEGSQEQIFFDEETSTEKVLAIIENVEHPDDLIDPKLSSPAFTIQNPPSASENKQLVTDLLLQDQHRRLKDATLCFLEVPRTGNLHGGINSESNCTLGHSDPGLLKGGDTAEQLRSFIRIKPEIRGSTTIFHISSLEGLTREDGAQYTRTIESLKSFIRYVLTTPSIDQESTIILVPPHSRAVKRSSGSPYGIYNTPSQPLHHRQLQSEEPLTSLSDAFSKSKPSSHPQPLKDTPPVKGILPICHASLKECNISTNNCSGHGTPYKKYSDPKSKAPACYACNCTTTVQTRKDGKIKTTKWGGPACQKKDVSVPFWLLTGFTIAMVATVSWAIGLVFSIGQEDLPSVIGAGVAGPRAQK
ncbi:hypothetical protein MMC07_006996 [Pseudocyphellaria aurata]|nr:hypothetical protein [Pseudocyphellaria aurata]